MIPVESTIEAVTVYRQGARVTRAARIEQNGGDQNQVRITGLPICLDDSSIRVRVESESGDASGSLPVAADARIALEVPELDASLPPAEDEALEIACKEEARLRDLVVQIERDLARIDKLVITARPKCEEGQPPIASPTAARLALLDFREARSQKLFDQLHDTREQLREAERIRHELEDRDLRATTARQAHESELRKSVIVTLQREHDHSDRIRLILEYLVPGARWAPAYTVLLQKDSEEAEMSMRAVVAQRTGEDWTGVALTLSTARAQQWTELPELTSLRIGRRQAPRPKLGWRPPPTGVEELYADYDVGYQDRLAKSKSTIATEFASEPDESAASDNEEDYATLPPGYVGYTKSDDGPGIEITAKDAISASLSLVSKLPAAVPEEMHDALPMAPESAAPFADEPMAAEAAHPRAARSRAGWRQRSRAPRTQISYDSQMPQEKPLDLRASDDMLAYGSLRMPPPRSAHRGRLVQADQTEIYLEILTQQRVVVSFDVMRAIHGSTVVAESIRDRRPPPRCAYAWSDHYDYAYVADTSVEIPSDGDFHSIPITGRSTSAAKRFVAVPRESSDVFRFAEVDNPLDAPLLQGPVDVYVDGEFLLTTEVGFTAPRGTMKLGLGVEQSIKVARNTRFREDPAGPLRASHSLQHEIQIEVINHLQRVIDLEVRERIPVTRQDEEHIKVELIRVEPSWEPFEPFPQRAASESELRGAYHWTLQVAPGATRELKVDYEVRIPSKLELIGGNRREA